MRTTPEARRVPSLYIYNEMVRGVNHCLGYPVFPCFRSRFFFSLLLRLLDNASLRIGREFRGEVPTHLSSPRRNLPQLHAGYAFDLAGLKLRAIGKIPDNFLLPPTSWRFLSCRLKIAVHRGREEEDQN